MPLDPDTGRDPALYPKPLDTWDTKDEGRIRVVGAPYYDTKTGRVIFVVYDGGARLLCTGTIWAKMIRGATLVSTAEDFLRENGVKPEWGGPPDADGPRIEPRPYSMRKRDAATLRRKSSAGTPGAL